MELDVFKKIGKWYTLNNKISYLNYEDIVYVDNY